MAKRTKCAHPECKKLIVGRLCYEHREHRERPGVCDVYCELCGYGPRASLIKHVIHAHDGTAAYRKQFGRFSLVSENFRGNSRDLLADRIGDGTAMKKARRQRTCRKGHPLTKGNVILINHRDGRVERQCRICRNERLRREWAEQSVWQEPPQRLCEWCQESYTAIKGQQRFCSAEHRQQALSFRIGQHFDPRECLECHEEYTPRVARQRFCSKCSPRRLHR